MKFKELALAAIEKNDVEEFKFLKIQYHFHFDKLPLAQENLAETFLHYSVVNNKLGMVRHLLEKEEITWSRRHLRWMFALAIGNCHLDIAQYLWQEEQYSYNRAISLFFAKKLLEDNNFWEMVMDHSLFELSRKGSSIYQAAAKGSLETIEWVYKNMPISSAKKRFQSMIADRIY